MNIYIFIICLAGSFLAGWLISSTLGWIRLRAQTQRTLLAEHDAENYRMTCDLLERANRDLSKYFRPRCHLCGKFIPKGAEAKAFEHGLLVEFHLDCQKKYVQKLNLMPNGPRPT